MRSFSSLGVVLVLLTAAPVAAQPSFRDVLRGGPSTGTQEGEETAPEASATPQARAAAEPTPTAEVDERSPRAAVVAFLEATRAGELGSAARFLDLRSQRSAARSSTARSLPGAELARRLDFVLDRKAWIDPEDLSPRPEGRRDDGLARNVDRLTTIDVAGREVELLLERVATPSGDRTWKLSGSSVDLIPSLYAQVSRGPLASLLPDVFFDVQFLDLQLWQWIGLLALGLVACAAAFVAALALHLLRPVLERTATGADEALLAASRGPARLAVGVFVFSIGIRLLGLPLVGLAFLEGIETVFYIAAFTWWMMRCLDFTSATLRQRMIARGHANAIFLLPPGRRAAKAVLLGIAAIALLDNLGFNVTAIVAGLGIGGIAVALAAQKSVENLFGGITLYFDQSVRIGDFCGFGDRAGTVEDIGLRSTRIRTNDRTVISVPNAEFANLPLENFSKRDRIWFHPTLGLRCETTPEQMRRVLRDVAEMLRSHPEVDADPRIRFVGFGAYSLDLEVFAYVRTSDYARYQEIAEGLNLRIMDIVAAAGASFAFPSQTTYLEAGEKPALVAATNGAEWPR